MGATYPCRHPLSRAPLGKKKKLLRPFCRFHGPLSKVFEKPGRKEGEQDCFGGKSLMKNEQIQEVKSSGVILILGLVVLSMIIIATPWNRQFQDSRIETALHKAEVVGYQVVQIYREAAKTSDNKDRAPASVTSSSGSAIPANIRSTGTMGLDPWGAPFRYRILSADPAGNVKILVWSSGPNQKVETAALDDEDVAIAGQPSYGGDDIGVLLSMTHQ